MATKYYTCLVIILILTGIVVRAQFAVHQFSHIDDFISVSVLFQTPTDSSWLFPNLANDFNEISPNLKNFTMFIVQFIEYPFRVAASSTYAPIQFLGLNLIIDDEMELNELVFYNRLPSLFYGSLALLIIPIIFKKILKENYMIPSIVSLSITSLSMMHTVYSGHSASYAIGVFAFYFFLFSYYLYAKSEINSYIFSTISFISFLMHYPIIIFVIGVFLYELMKNLKKPRNIFLLIGPAIVFNSLFFLYYKIILSNKINKSVNSWNTGPNGEYLYINTGIQDLFNFIQFTTHNSIVVLNSITSWGQTTSEWAPFDFSTFNFSILILLSGYGIYHLVIHEQRFFGAGPAICISFAIYIVLVYFGKLTMSPTRHSLFLLGPLSFTIGVGTYALIEKFLAKRAKLSKYLITSITLGAVGAYLYSAQVELARRAQIITEQEISSIIDTYKPDMVLTVDATFQPSFSNAFNELYVTDHRYSLTGTKLFLRSDERNSNSVDSETIFIIGHRKSLDIQSIEHSIFSVLNRRPRSIRLEYLKELDHGPEMEPFPLTENGANNMFFYVVKIMWI